MPASKDENGNIFTGKSRYYVEGIVDDPEGNALYMNKDISDYPFGSGSAFRYVP